MKKLSALLLALLILPSLATAQDQPTAIPVESLPQLPLEFCYAPGTSMEVVERNAQRAAVTQMLMSLQPSGFNKHRLDDGDQWTNTATNGNIASQGDPITLTWSIIPDGTSIFGYAGEATSDSQLISFLNGIYGNQATWLALFEQVFDRWSELTGITYVYEPNDDGSDFLSNFIAAGSLGVRGDIRIGGHPIDGNSNILAYNFFPNTGDMIIDAPDSFYDNTANNSQGFRNVISHEHGHGLGFSHVCPVNQTKLMEPFVSFAFDGPQHDDILAANRGYGDASESNDSSGTATALDGLMSTLTNRSIDDNSDIDFYALTTAGGGMVDVTVTPQGSTYLEGPQNPNGTCTAGTNYDTLNRHNLSIRLLDTDGSTELASVDANGAGAAEMLSAALSSGAGTYYIEVSGDSTNLAQLYSITVEADTPEIFEDGFESGDVCIWTSSQPASCPQINE